MRLWLIVIGMGVVTYAIRLSVFAIVPHSALPRVAREALRFVTPAILAAIIAPAVLYAGSEGGFDASPANERLLAALFAGGVAWLAGNVWLTIAAGMGALWLLRWAA